MSEHRELSELPEDDAYWAALERRVTGELGPRVRALAAEPARPGGRVGAAAAALLVALLPPRPPSGAALTGAAAFLPASGDPTVVAMLGAPAPPSLASLVLPAGGGSDE